MRTGKAIRWAIASGGIITVVGAFFWTVPGNTKPGSPKGSEPARKNEAASAESPSPNPLLTVALSDLPTMPAMEQEVENQLAVAQAPGEVIEDTLEFRARLTANLQVQDDLSQEDDRDYPEKMAGDLLYPILQAFAFGKKEAVALKWSSYSMDNNLPEQLLRMRSENPGEFEWKKIQLEDGPVVRIVDPAKYLEPDEHPGDPLPRHLARVQQGTMVKAVVGIKYDVVSRDGKMFYAEFFFAEDEESEFRFLGGSNRFKPGQMIEVRNLQDAPPSMAK